MKDELGNNFYHNSLEHLTDELLKLDLKIQLKINKMKYNSPDNPNHEFKGIFISDQEVEQLINRNEDHQQNEGSEVNKTKALIKESIRRKEQEIAEKLENSQSRGIKLSLVELAELFALTELEQQIILSLLAPEIDRKYEKIYAFLQDDMTRKWPSLALLILLNEESKETCSVKQLLQPDAKLLKALVVECVGNMHDNTITQLSKVYRLDSRIVNYLLEVLSIDANINNLVSTVHPFTASDESFGEDEKLDHLYDLIHTGLNKVTESIHLIYLRGLKGIGKKTLVRNVCQKLNKQLIIVKSGSIIQVGLDSKLLISRLIRECVLGNSFLLIEDFDSLDEELLQFVLETLNEIPNKKLRFLFISGISQWVPESDSRDIRIIHVDFEQPNASKRLEFWKHEKAKFKLTRSIDLNEIATKFRFTPAQIKASLNTSYDLALSKNREKPIISKDELYMACRMHSGKNLGKLAQPIISEYNWKDIVLPEETLQQLKAICTHVKLQDKVFDEWGFGKKTALGKGINALFSGPSGTGKTMAASIIANDLKLDLYRIDLSQIVSKYIGETEKNLEKIFKEAESSNAILFFDEADALFGKRTEIRDSHDRYANVEVSYLLQRMESYEGISLLATNLKQNIDEAFIRRLRFVVEFPFPEAVYRKYIWEKNIPKAIKPRKKIDYDLLAGQLKVTGGHIRNIAIKAAFLAASNSGKLNMNYLVDAAKEEYKKMGRVLHNAELFTEHKQKSR